MDYREYQHVERFGTAEVEDIEIGTCYVFPKIDGTNGVIWRRDNGSIGFGARRRDLGDDDNQGFQAAVRVNDLLMESLAEYFESYRNRILYGEWLVPHTLKTYRSEAWQRFYVFDVYNATMQLYLPYQEYTEELGETLLNLVIPPIAILINPTEEKLVGCLEKNTFLMRQGEIGEGIVIKNYAYRNKYGRQTWAKMVRAEFRDSHLREMGPSVYITDAVEDRIITKFTSQIAVITEKILADLESQRGSTFSTSWIPEILGRAFHDFVVEETWEMLKTFKNPKIDYGRLHKLVIGEVKKTLKI